MPDKDVLRTLKCPPSTYYLEPMYTDARYTRTRNVLKRHEEQYEAVLAGLPDAELEFVKSAGQGEEMRLLHQVDDGCMMYVCLLG